MTSVPARMKVLCALVFGLLTVLLPIPDTGAGEAAPETAEATLLDRYNQRGIGDPGLRRIRLELHNDGTMVRRFDIAHAWQRSRDPAGRDAAEIRSLVLLEDPANLRGTDYLLVEGSSEASNGTGLEVHLHLPTSNGRVLEIRPGGFDEGLLGSDFGYTDLLWRIPLAGRRVESLGSSTIGTTEVWGYEVTPETDVVRAGSSWDRRRYFLSRDPALLRAAEFYRDDDGAPSRTPGKRLAVYDWHERDGVWTPGKMVMRSASGRSSTLTLRTTRFEVEPLPAEIFSPEALPRFTETLRSGEMPEFLAPLATD